MKYKTAIFLIIGIIIMVVILNFIGIDEVIEALKIANFSLILLAIAVQFLTYYLLAFRWNIINKIANINVSMRSIFLMILVGFSINNITPSGRGGGEPVRAFILSKYAKRPYEETFATVIADRALDMFPFLVLSILSVIFIILYFDLSNLNHGNLVLTILIISVVGVTAASGLVIYTSINEKFGKKATKFVLKLINKFYKKDPKSLEKKAMNAISGFQKTMRMMISDKKILYHALPLSFLIWVSEILRVYIVFLAFEVNVPPLLIGVVFIVASLIGMIPLLPGGLGAVEGIMISFYSLAGIPPSISAAATVIERLISFWLTTILGFIILPYFGVSVLDKIKSSNPTEEETAKERIEELDNVGEHEKTD